MRKIMFFLVIIACFFLFSTVCIAANVPQEINYQGFVEVEGVPFDGPGDFKFTITNQAGDTYYWTNDGSTPTPPNPPTSAVNLQVNGGLLSVRLGDSSHPNMIVLPPSVFENQDTWLEVWFDAGSGFQKLGPKQKFASVPYAMMAQTIPDDSINGWKLQRESVWPEHEGRGNTIVALFAIYGATPGATATFDFDPSTPAIDPVPTGKTFVITDIIFGEATTGIGNAASCQLQYVKDSKTTILLQRWKSAFSNGSGYAYSYEANNLQLKGGFPVPAGATLQVYNYQYSNSNNISISGFMFSY